MTHRSLHQLIIIGSGPAGLTAALYAARAQLKPLVFTGNDPGGQLMGTTAVENWPGMLSVQGPELMDQLTHHAQIMGAVIMQQSLVKVDFTQRPFLLWNEKGASFYAASVIIATGATPRRLGCIGESLYWGRGVSSCAVCDASFYRNKRVIVVGGGDSAMEYISILAAFASEITVVHIREQFTASALLQQRVNSLPGITYLFESTVIAIEGDGTRVTGVTVLKRVSNTVVQLPVDGVFIAIGHTPNSMLFKEQIQCDHRGYIQVDQTTQTSKRGIFAAGDVVDSRYRQAITSAGEGCKAALDALWYLQESPLNLAPYEASSSPAQEDKSLL